MQFIKNKLKLDSLFCTNISILKIAVAHIKYILYNK